MENADFHDLSMDHKCALWTWKNIVFIKATGIWSIEESHSYINRFWDMFTSLKKNWNTIYFLIDTNYMEIQSESFRRYMKEEWGRLADQEELSICIIENKDMKRLIWMSIHQLLGIADKIQLFKDHRQAFLWLDKKTNYEKGLPNKLVDSTRHTTLRVAQKYITDRLLSLLEQMDLKIDDLAWDQRVNDWKAEIHFLAVSIAGKRFALPFNEIELTQDQGTENWKKIIDDKVNWFLTEELTLRKYNRYRQLDTGKSWIEAQLRKISGPIKKTIQIVEWRNPDEWRYDIPLSKGAVGLTVKISGKQLLLMFTLSDIQACENSPDVQSKLLKYIEAKFVFD